jgi:hypothetical protein
MRRRPILDRQECATVLTSGKVGARHPRHARAKERAARGSGPSKHETPESAEAALAFLVEQEMVEVAGDTITVPARF